MRVGRMRRRIAGDIDVVERKRVTHFGHLISSLVERAPWRRRVLAGAMSLVQRGCRCCGAAIRDLTAPIVVTLWSLMAAGGCTSRRIGRASGAIPGPGFLTGIYFDWTVRSIRRARHVSSMQKSMGSMASGRKLRQMSDRIGPLLLPIQQ